jgi:hypothetical protein
MFVRQFLLSFYVLLCYRVIKSSMPDLFGDRGTVARCSLTTEFPTRKFILRRPGPDQGQAEGSISNIPGHQPHLIRISPFHARTQKRAKSFIYRSYERRMS